MSDDDVPDLTEYEEGDEVRVFYRSQRSGNEVSRTGDVALIRTGEDGPIVYVHTDRPEPLKQVYVALVDATTKSGNECVVAYSATAEPDNLDLDERLDLRRSYHFTMEITRTSTLGIVDRIEKRGGTVLAMTDGGVAT